jgi:hypothetical protein
MTRTTLHRLALLAATVPCLTLAALLLADAPPGEESHTAAPATQPSGATSGGVTSGGGGATTQPSGGTSGGGATSGGGGGATAEDVIKNLTDKRTDPAPIEPTVKPAPGSSSGSGPGGNNEAPSITNPAGTAPDLKPGQLRREGEFLVNRRGRVVRGASGGSGGNVLFVFEGDGEKSPEAPMVLLPCQKTQGLEDIVRDRGDRAVFIVTGQVFTYHGANYFLPTITKEDFDHGNLKR